MAYIRGLTVVESLYGYMEEKCPDDHSSHIGRVYIKATVVAMYYFSDIKLIILKILQILITGKYGITDI